MIKEKSNKAENLRVYETLQKIKERSLDPKLLSKEARLLCVEALVVEGQPLSSIAILLKKSDRTIRRDVREIQSQNALKSSPQLTQMLIGELVSNARSHLSRLRRISNLNEASPSDKARTEFLAWRVSKELVDKLYLVGFISAEHCQGNSDSASDERKNSLEFTEKDKEIAAVCKYMHPFDRERLIERLRHDINRIDEEIEEAGKEEINEIECSQEHSDQKVLEYIKDVKDSKEEN